MLRKLLTFRSLGFKKRSFQIKLRKILGFYPSDLSLYQIALTHKSASYHLKGERVNNERLEFLGDAILDAVISDFLYKKYPNEKEGFLTEMRSKIVNGDKLKELAVKMKIDDYISQKTSHPVASSRIYEDAFEALIGAIYLDKGFNTVYKFIDLQILSRHIDFNELEILNQNYKSQLIEWSQKTKIPVEFQSIPDEENSNMFISQVVVEEKNIGTGKGYSKREAEQNAAQEALIYMKMQGLI
ncbi:MAG: ribonuclease III [Bacteroidales bacterium]